MIRVQNLTKTFNTLRAVNDISFSVKSGEFFAFLGPNGAGKTTTMKILATLLRPTSGTATVNGYDVVREANNVRRSIGMVFQDPSLDDRLTAEENMHLHGVLYGMERREMRRRMDLLLDMVGLSDRRKELVRTYSGGMKRRLEIARGLLHQPRVLFLDEPTVGLDPQTRNHIWEYISQVRKAMGSTIFLTTHYMEEAEACDRVGIIDHGRLIALDTPNALKKAVSSDVLTIKTANPETAAAQIREELNLQPDVRGELITLSVPDGETLLPRLAASLPSIKSISLSKPTLENVFLNLTGRAIREEQGGALESIRIRRRSRRGRY